MLIHNIDIESIVTMLNATTKYQSKSDKVQFARGSHKLITDWKTLKKRLN